MRSSENEQIVTTFKTVYRRRKRLILACLAVVLVGVTLFNELTTPEYEATTSFVYDEFASPVTAAPSDHAYSEEVRIANRLAEIGSYSMAAAVAEALPADARHRIEAWKEPAARDDTLRVVASIIQESIAAQSLPSSNIVRVAVRMREPEIAMQVANTLAEVMRSRSLRTKQEGTSGARQFIEEQLQRYSDQLGESEQGLKAFKERNALTSYDDEAKEILRRSTEAEVLYNTAVANRHAVADRLEAVEKELNQQKRDLVPRVTDVASPSLMRVRQKLVDLQAEYQDLKIQGYPSEHPKMKELAQEITQTQQNLTSEAQRLAAGEIALDPVSRIDKFVTDAIALRMEIVSLSAQETALKRVIDGYDARLATLPSKEYDLVRMTRDRDLSQKIYSMLQEKLQEARISEAEQRPEFRTIDRALLPIDPVKPRKKLNYALGGMLGLMLGFGLAFVREGFASSVDSTRLFERTSGWRVLASIPRVDRLPQVDEPTPDSTVERRERRRILRALVTYYDRSGGVAEAYRKLRTSLNFGGFGEELKVLLVSSMVPGEGKTTTVSNLAIAMAELGHPTLVIDGEIRKPGMHLVFRVLQSPGLTDILQGTRDTRQAPVALAWREEGGGDEDEDDVATTRPGAPADKALQTSGNGYGEFLQPTFVPNLTVVPSGGASFESAQGIAVETGRLRDFLVSARGQFRYVLIDAPPLMLVHDVALLSSLVDGVLLVVDSRNFDKEMLSDGRASLENARANVVGVVLNHVEPIGVYKKNSYYTT